jgi:hypothetical protein
MSFQYERETKFARSRPSWAVLWRRLDAICKRLGDDGLCRAHVLIRGNAVAVEVDQRPQQLFRYGGAVICHVQTAFMNSAATWGTMALP